MSQQRDSLRKAMGRSITIAAASYLVGCFLSELAANERRALPGEIRVLQVYLSLSAK